MRPINLSFSASVDCLCIPQLIRDNANFILGSIRTRRPGQLRFGWHQDIHPFLGHAHVRHLFRHQHSRPVELADRHDESFISINLGEWNGMNSPVYTNFCLRYFFEVKMNISEQNLFELFNRHECLVKHE